MFDRLKKAGLMLNPKTCGIVCNEVEYLGHIVTPQGLKPNNRNLDAVKKFSPPTSLKQLQQFLGLTSYYRRFIPDSIPATQSHQERSIVSMVSRM